MKLRIATEHNVQRLHDIGIESYRYHFTNIWNNDDELTTYLHSEYSIQKILGDMQQPDVRWFLIENPQPVGLVKLTYHAQISDEALTGTLLNKLYFLPNSTGKGNGKTVFKQIEGLAKAHGDDLLWLKVLAENTSAVHFYQANGMDKIKEIIFSSETQQSLEFIMSKTL